MANTVQEHPYEILVRFNCDTGELAGGVRGMHTITQAVVVDDAGIIVGRLPEQPATPVDQDKVDEIIGATFAAATRQLDDAQARLKASDERVAELTAKVDEQRAELDAFERAGGAVIEQAEMAAAAMTEKDKQLAAAYERIDELEKAMATVAAALKH